ncbi:MAG TPA: hypothetical protein VM238_15605, partial [Phycisphaerae bacterium]|nr:hypothetical protein [Phycisphaerae bacterium]
MTGKRAGASEGRAVRALAALTLGTFLLVGAVSCVETIRVAPPPPAPAATKAPATFDYDHQLR